MDRWEEALCSVLNFLILERLKGWGLLGSHDGGWGTWDPKGNRSVSVGVVSTGAVN